MTENLASLDETVPVGPPFGTTTEELRLAAIGSKIEFAKSELQTVQAYIDVVYAGRFAVTTDDGSELPADPLAHLGSVLSNYEQALFDQIAELEYEQEMLLFPPDEDEDGEDAEHSRLSAAGIDPGTLD